MRKVFKLIGQNEPLFYTLILVAILRIPNLFEPYWYADEAIYLTIGQAINKGAILYKDIFDHKTPLIYFVASIFNNLIAWKFLLLMVSATTVFLSYKLSFLFFPKNWNKRIFWLIGSSLAISLPYLEGNILNAELLLIPITLSVIYFMWQSKPRFGLVGILMGLAFLIKVPVIFEFTAIIYFYFLTEKWRGNNLVKLLSGFMFPVVIVLGYFGANGQIESLIKYGFVYNYRYIAQWGGNSLLSMSLRILALILVSLLAYAKRKRFKNTEIWALLWLGYSLFAALISFRPYPHYFLQVVPAIVLAASFLTDKSAKKRVLFGSLILLIYFSWQAIGLKTLSTWNYYRNFINFASKQTTQETFYETFDKRMGPIYQTADYLRKRTALDEKIFIWGDEPMIYAYARRGLVGKYITDYHILSIEGAKTETIQALEEQRPRYIVLAKADLNNFEELKNLITSQYHYVTEFGYITILKRNLI